MDLDMKITAMIVDDEPFAREDLRHMLSDYAKVEVKWEAAKLNEARSLLAQHCPDVLFLDIDLRGGSGFDLIPSVDQEKTNVIFVTGHSELADKIAETGALDCLSKPVSGRYLGQSLEKLEHALASRDK
jgi:two-component system LytT family response regulator